MSNKNLIDDIVRCPEVWVIGNSFVAIESVIAARLSNLTISITLQGGIHSDYSFDTKKNAEDAYIVLLSKVCNLTEQIY